MPTGDTGDTDTPFTDACPVLKTCRFRPHSRNTSLGGIANDSQLDQFWPKPLKRHAFCRGGPGFSPGSASRSRAACSLHQSKGLASGWAVSSLTWARREPSVPGLFRCRGRLEPSLLAVHRQRRRVARKLLRRSRNIPISCYRPRKASAGLRAAGAALSSMHDTRRRAPIPISPGAS
jgi:hypothetical protein